MNTNTGEHPSSLFCFSELRRHDAGRGVRIVVENRRKPAFAFADTPVFPPRVIFDLIAFDLADAEIRALWVAEIKPAHSSSRPHRIALGQLHADALTIEQTE